MDNKWHVTFDMGSTTPVIQTCCFSTISYSVLQPGPTRHPVQFLIYRVKAIALAMSEVPRDLWAKSRALGKDLASGTPSTLEKKKSRMRKTIDNCFKKIHHCMIAKMKLQNYGHLAFRAPLLRGLTCSQRPRHNFAIGHRFISELKAPLFPFGSETWKCHDSGDGCLEPEQAVAFGPSIPDGSFIPVVTKRKSWSTL